MADDDVLLIALGAAVILGGISFGKITEPIRDITKPVGNVINYTVANGFRDNVIANTATLGNYSAIAGAGNWIKTWFS